MTEANVAAPRETPVANPLFEYVLRIADDRLVLGHRLSEWCGHGPILEEDIALSNIALDFIGQANALLALAGQLEGKGRDEDALAYFRDERDFRNALLVELPNGDFGHTIVRQFLFDAYSVLYLDALARCGHQQLSALAAKSLKEDTYHLRHSSEWMLRLGDGTVESHDRAQRALDELWRFTGELFESDAVDAAVAANGITVDRGAIQARWHDLVADVVKRATLTLPGDVPMATGGRRGRHSEHLGHMLAEMQIIARSHPGASW
ncbi:MAG: 1,2-phenylacetyl-CoA epoxidase subunit PaaC [Gemmatimonadaceae bacterium]|nr:1,2-phenylacetyl-CoA epoxidase subunit PaaC [Gemmatimonadaceae bacterium]